MGYKTQPSTVDGQMVDWSIARTLARLAAGGEGSAQSALDLPALCDEMEPHVASYTGLVLAAERPAAETVNRSEWASVNIDSLSKLLDPVAARLEDRCRFAGPLAGALPGGASATLAAEAGLVMGYMSQRVLGQYELSLLAPIRPPRLLFVAPNLDKAVRDLEVDARGLLPLGRRPRADPRLPVPGRAVAARPHERPAARVPRTVEVRIEHGAAGGMPSLPDPRKLVEAFREGGLAALVQTDDSEP